MKITLSLKSLFAFALLLTVLNSCNDKHKLSEEPNNIVYDSLSVSKIYHLDNDSTKPSCSLKIKYTYPVNYTNTEVVKNIQKELNFLLFEDESSIKLTPNDALGKYVNDYVESYKRDAAMLYSEEGELDEPDTYYSFYKTIYNQVIFDKAGLTSYQITFTDYKGGDKSTANYRNAVFDLTTGNVLTEQDIFQLGYKEMLNLMFISKILNQNKVQKVDDLRDFGYLDIEDIMPNGNFYVDAKGVTYIFNRGEYTILSLGEIKTFFTYDELKEILKPKTALSPLSGI